MSHDAGSRPSRRTLAVLGAGAWGHVLASLLAEAGHAVRLWTRSSERAELLNRGGGPVTGARRSPRPTAGGAVLATSDLAAAVRNAHAAFLAVPSAALPALLEQLAADAAAAPPALVSCSKGLLAPGLRRPSQLIADAFPERAVAVLSGPNLAGEIAAGLPAAATVASRDAAFAADVQTIFGPGRFRLYTGDDPAGIEVAGAYKNVIAMAAGMSDALKLGENAKASLITRGLAEMVRLGRHLGGRERTFYGLGGVGDLVATCASGASRNHLAGERLARGATIAELESERLTAEGIGTVRAVVGEAERVRLVLPIASQVHAVAFEGVPADEAVHALLARDPRGEWDLGGQEAH